jgi:hypothetical protein
MVAMSQEAVSAILFKTQLCAYWKFLIKKIYICRMAEELMLALCRHFLLEKFFNKLSLIRLEAAEKANRNLANIRF